MAPPSVPFAVLSFVAQNAGVAAEILITFQDASGAETRRKKNRVLNSQIYNFKSPLCDLFITVRIHDTALKVKGLHQTDGLFRADNLVGAKRRKTAT